MENSEIVARTFEAFSRINAALGWQALGKKILYKRRLGIKIRSSSAWHRRRYTKKPISSWSK